MRFNYRWVIFKNVYNYIFLLVFLRFHNKLLSSMINSIYLASVSTCQRSNTYLNERSFSDVAKILTKSSITGCTWSLCSSSKVSRNLDQSRTFCYRLTVIKHFRSFWGHADSQDKRAAAAISSSLSLSTLLPLSEVRFLYSILSLFRWNFFLL